MTRPLRLAFMGSPDFAVPTLAALADAGHEIACVYAQPPRPAGRGRKLRPNPVQAYAASRGWPVRTPTSLKDDEARAAFTALDLDGAIVVAYGLLLTRAILDAPRLGCINLHASCLPRWRGAAPIQRALMAGDTQTGVDAMLMEPGLDTGPVLASQRCAIGDTDTAGTLHDRLASLAAELAPRALAAYARGTLKPVAQATRGITYARKIGPEDQPIDWARTAHEIDCQIRGLSPTPGAWFDWMPPGADQPMRIKALMSRVETASGSPGTVLDDGLLVACGRDAVRLTHLQRPGKGPTDTADFLRGNTIAEGTALA